jgi:hypothetical protein
LNGRPCTQPWRRRRLTTPLRERRNACTPSTDQHQHPDGAKHDHIAKRHHQIDLAQFAQQREKLHAGSRSGQPAHQQHRAHLEVDRLAPPMHQNPRERGPRDLIGPGRHRHRRGNADQDQQGRDQKPAADPEQARDNADAPAQRDQQVDVDRNLGDGEIDLHESPAGVGATT